MNKEKKESKKEKEFNQIIKDLSFSIRIQDYDNKEETQKFKKSIEKLEEKLELTKKFKNNEIKKKEFNEQLQQLKDELQKIKESITIINTNEENNNASGLEKLNESGLEKINASGLEKLNENGLEKINASGLEKLNESGLEKKNESGLEKSNESGLEKRNEEELEKNIQLISDLPNYLGKKYEENKKKISEYEKNMKLKKNEEFNKLIEETENLKNNKEKIEKIIIYLKDKFTLLTEKSEEKGLDNKGKIDEKKIKLLQKEKKELEKQVIVIRKLFEKKNEESSNYLNKINSLEKQIEDITKQSNDNNCIICDYEINEKDIPYINQILNYNEDGSNLQFIKENYNIEYYDEKKRNFKKKKKSFLNKDFQMKEIIGSNFLLKVL